MSLPNFGLEGFLPYVLYGTAVIAFLLSVFWRPIAGIFYLTPLIPLQTIRYRLNDLPLGASIVGVMLVGIAIGLLRRRQSVLPKTPWTLLLVVYAVFTFVSLCFGSVYLGVPLPVPGDTRFGVWQDYMTMPALLLLVAAVAPTRGEIKALVLVMCLAVLVLDRSFWNAVSGRDFSSYSEDLREDGMGYAGTNGLAAFEAQYTIFLLALASFEPKRLLRLGYLALAAFSTVCLVYSLSRGGYAALLAGCLFIGFLKQRTVLLLLAVFALTWTAIVPNAVFERVTMTYDERSGTLDPSAEARVLLWEDAIDLFRSSPAVGTGFDTYAYMHRVGAWDDTHNLFLKLMAETGIAGLVLFLALLAKTFWTGFRLSRCARDPFLASLGLGLAGWMVCAVVANFFGDRWTYLQVNGYMWVISGLVAQAWVLEKSGAPAEAESALDTAGAPPLEPLRPVTA